MKKWRLVYLQLVFAGILISLFGLAGVAISVLIKGSQKGFSIPFLLDKPGYFILMAGLLAFIPCLIALIHILKILRSFKSNATAAAVASSFGIITICGYIISAVAICLFPVMFIVADRDDAPGLILFAFLLILIPFTLSVVSSLFQSIIRNYVRTDLTNP
ncbi:hypothetical protein Exig_1456 [Exiguobacterium sibiricum 255-15]|uniref:DUF2975 domain-containing protein n=1 Tax=Exiguobacterium sibiricum (strain DSM 17290 / CCUG 55495 / CIP 109462 / JCM 13490 / 255-15) TaxID=262543 RepID=B1YFZ0_EXIS2|nr:hypothetical protein [Exiguobacterium sibiricum]ACB60917.1 hypothetical protein Exig_1456 [Exiguobacterium sibiricum 255-15]